MLFGRLLNNVNNSFFTFSLNVEPYIAFEHNNPKFLSVPSLESIYNCNFCTLGSFLALTTL